MGREYWKPLLAVQSTIIKYVICPGYILVNQLCQRKYNMLENKQFRHQACMCPPSRLKE